MVLSLLVLLWMPLDIAQNYTYAKLHEESRLFLILSRKNERWHYLRMINSYYLGQNKELDESAHFLLNSFRAPHRYRHLAFVLRMEMQNFSREELQPIHQKMDRVSARLKNAKAGKITQKIQREIVSGLDNLIKNMEDSRNKAAAQAHANASKIRNTQPARDSNIIPGQERVAGRVNMKKFAWSPDLHTILAKLKY